MHKAVIFDLGRVLVHFDFKRGYQALESCCPYTADEIPQRLWSEGMVERLEKGLIEPAPFVEWFCRTLDVRLDYPQFCEIWGSIFAETLIPEEMLAGLAARYRLLLLSNTNAIHFETIRRNYGHLLRHFHELVLSYEVNAMKPEPAIYQAAIARAGCKPEECFYTDDIPAFVEGGKKAGLDAVQFTSAAQIAEELRTRGIEWQ